MSYAYTQQNRLLEPHGYMYTPYEGTVLLGDYLADRETAARRFAARAAPGQKLDRAFAGRAARTLGLPFDTGAPTEINLHDLSASLQRLAVGAEVDCTALLQGLVAAALIGSPSAAAIAWIDRLLQRFEVTKRIYAAYLPGFRKGRGAHDSFRLYWLFALALCLHYARNPDLRYLNGLLKVSDLLCSIGDDGLREDAPDVGMAVVLAAETSFVVSLATAKGVRLAA